jgi:DNA polymerase-3 subunit gamma/tau
VIASARSGIAPTRTGAAPAKPATDDRDADAHPDDPEADDNGIEGAELLQRELGATVIDEIPHE